MKKTLLFAIFTICAVQSTFAQSIVENKIDKFTESKIVQVNVSNSKRWKQGDNITKGLINNVFLSFRHTEGRNFLQFGVQCQTGMLCISQESKAILLLEDDTKLELINHNQTECSHTIVSGKYLVTSLILDELKSKKIKEFRIYYSDGYRDYVVKDDKQDLIQNTISTYIDLTL